MTALQSLGNDTGGLLEHIRVSSELGHLILYWYSDDVSCVMEREEKEVLSSSDVLCLFVVATITCVMMQASKAFFSPHRQ